MMKHDAPVPPKRLPTSQEIEVALARVRARLQSPDLTAEQQAELLDLEKRLQLLAKMMSSQTGRRMLAAQNELHQLQAIRTKMDRSPSD